MSTRWDDLYFSTVKELRQYLADRKWVASIVEGCDDLDQFEILVGNRRWPTFILVGGLKDRHGIPRFPHTPDGLYYNPNIHERRIKEFVTWDEVLMYFNNNTRVITDGIY